MNNKTKVVILCGGLGTRLREETEYRPKPMVEIGKFPILWHIMKYYSTYGFKDFIICLGYKGEKIKEFFFNYELLNSDFTVNLSKKIFKIHTPHDEDWNVTLVNTGENTLKGSRIKQIENFIDNDIFMVSYGDCLADVNINKLIEFHKNHGKIGTITGVRPPSRFGEMILEGNQIKHFTEKPQVSNGSINGGFFVFNKSIFKRLSLNPSCDLEKGVLENLSKEGELMSFQHKGNWECMDNLRDMKHLNDLWNSNSAFWKTW